MFRNPLVSIDHEDHDHHPRVIDQLHQKDQRKVVDLIKIVIMIDIETWRKIVIVIVKRIGKEKR
jgi:hypothetical protein